MTKRRSLFAHPVVDLTGRMLRPIVPARLWHRYCDWRYSHLGRHSWLAREDKLDGHIDVYWKSMTHPNRTQLIGLLGGPSTIATSPSFWSSGVMPG